MSSRPSLRYNSITQQWEVVGKGGQINQKIGDNGITSVTQINVGGASNVSRVYKFVATLSAAVTAGSGVVGVGTLQSATGSGVGCSQLAVGDFVEGVPKTALDSVMITGFHVPTTNTLNVYVQPRLTAGGGSLAVIGFDIFSIR